MSIKSFLIKNALRMKGMPKEQAEAVAEQISANPEIVEAMKKIESHPELKILMEKIQKETEEKINSGMDTTMATAGVMMKYKNDLAKYREFLEPLLLLLQR